MKEKLKKCREAIINDVKLAFSNTKNISPVIILISNNYENFFIPAGDVVKAKKDINKIKKEQGNILGFYYVSMIVINDEIKVAIAGAYNNSDLKITIFDINDRVLLFNNEQSRIQTENIVKKEKNKSSFPFLFSNN